MRNLFALHKRYMIHRKLTKAYRNLDTKAYKKIVMEAWTWI